MRRNLWPALALVFGMLAAGAIGYISGQGSQQPVALTPAALPAITQPAAPLPQQPTIAQVEAPAPASSEWRGLMVAAEHRCAPYDADDYPYSQSVEAQLVAQLGRRLRALYRTLVREHRRDGYRAHGGALRGPRQRPVRRREFAGDPLNLTLAAPELNRYDKVAKDAAAWLPALNQCWFAARVVNVRRKYALTIDRAEADALDRVLAGCTSLALIVTEPPVTGASAPAPPPPAATPAPTVAPPATVTAAATPETGDALDLYDDNGNGRITCAEARKHGIAPVHRGHPAYEYMRDGDSDGVVCE